MLKRLRVKNFKSLENFEAEFGKLNVLVGRNNSGKSNILDVLSFLGEGFKDPVEKIFIRRGGYKKVVFGGNEENDIEIETEFELDINPEKLLLEYHIKISGKYDAVKVIGEKLKIKRDNELVYESPDLELFGNYTKIQGISREVQPDDFVAGLYYARMLLQIPIYVYKITPQNIKSEYPEAFIDKDLNLDKGCENLALFLLKLSQQDKKKFERIKELLFGVIDDVEDISPNILGKRIYLKFKDRNFDKYFYPESMSDGTISLLSYITIIEATGENAINAIVCFEEPENYIHMRLLEFLVDLMRNSGKQIILATHSPYFIDKCEPDELLIIEKENGKTTARKIDSESIKKEIADYGGTLGEIYYSDGLGKEKGE